MTTRAAELAQVAATLDQTAAEQTAGVVPTNFGYVELDARRYGYKADAGTTDNSTPLSNAVAVAAVSGGTIQLPRGGGYFSSFPSLVNLQGIIFQGVAPTDAGGSNGSVLVYTGTGAGNVVNANSARGVQFKQLQFIHNNAGFTGTYFVFGSDGVHGNAYKCGLFDCFVGASVSNVTHLNLDKVQDFTAERCLFFSGNPSVRGQANGGGSFSNIVRFRDCEWTGSISIPVIWGGESWLFESCDFEGLSNGLAGAFDGGSVSNVSKGMCFLDCWFGDVTASGGTWIAYYGLALNVISCRLGGFATSTQAINLASVSGANIIGNNFDTFSAAINFGAATNPGVVIVCNNFVTVTNVFSNGANAPATLICNPNNVAGALVPLIAAVNGSLATSGYETSSNGVIRMWGQKTVTAGTPLAITFSAEVGRAFPNNCFQADCWFGATPGASATGTYTSSTSTTGTTLNVAGGTATNTVNWQAVGN